MTRNNTRTTLGPDQHRDNPQKYFMFGLFPLPIFSGLIQGGGDPRYGSWGLRAQDKSCDPKYPLHRSKLENRQKN